MGGGGGATAAPRNVTRRGVPYHMYTCSDAHARRARHHRSVDETTAPRTTVAR